MPTTLLDWIKDALMTVFPDAIYARDIARTILTRGGPNYSSHQIAAELCKENSYSDIITVLGNVKKYQIML